MPYLINVLNHPSFQPFYGNIAWYDIISFKKTKTVKTLTSPDVYSNNIEMINNFTDTTQFIFNSML